MSQETGRRNFLLSLGSTVAASLLLKQQAKADFPALASPFRPGGASLAAGSFVSVQTPGVPNLKGRMNGRVGNGVKGSELPPVRARVGDRIRIRVSNLSMLTHPVHLHGHQFVITDWGGGFLPEHQQIRANTINVSSAEVRVLEFTARAPGNWMFHCHFTHHTMNDMDRPPLPGTPPMDGMPNMDMGGMSTWIEVT